MAAYDKALGSVVTPHAHAGAAQAAPPLTPLLCRNPPAAPSAFTLTEPWSAEWMEKQPKVQSCFRGPARCSQLSAPGSRVVLKEIWNKRVKSPPEGWWVGH
eukprot:1159394-Pelagomonas_calceolata.AAC.15